MWFVCKHHTPSCYLWFGYPWKIRQVEKEIPEMNEHFIHLESPSSFISSVGWLPYFILSDFDAFWHGIVIDQKSGISWPSPIKNDTFFKTIKIFLLYILDEWKGNYPILCSMQHFAQTRHFFRTDLRASPTFDGCFETLFGHQAH